MREYGVEKCACGRYIAYKPSSYFMWIVAQTGKLENTQGDDPGFCAGCNMKFGIDERGPWREQMVPRAALEWLAGISEGCAQASPCPAAVLSYDKREAACRECLVQAALKAAEEATQSE